MSSSNFVIGFEDAAEIVFTGKDMDVALGPLAPRALAEKLRCVPVQPLQMTNKNYNPFNQEKQNYNFVFDFRIRINEAIRKLSCTQEKILLKCYSEKLSNLEIKKNEDAAIMAVREDTMSLLDLAAQTMTLFEPTTQAVPESDQ